MPTEMELTLEQTQQGVSYEVSFDESNANVLERFYTLAGNPVKEILLKLNLPDHRILKDGGEDFRYSDTEHLSRSDEVLKLKNFKKDATLKLSKSTNQEWRCEEESGNSLGKVCGWRMYSSNVQSQCVADSTLSKQQGEGVGFTLEFCLESLTLGHLSRFFLSIGHAEDIFVITAELISAL
ncbi:hypothetical protein Tco_1503808 [Tanacetum coccineum]